MPKLSPAIFFSSLFNAILVTLRWVWSRRFAPRGNTELKSMAAAGTALILVSSQAAAAAASMFLISAAHAAPTEQSAAETPSIDEGFFLNVNGVEQWVTIRSADRNNPVLLFLHGGPGIGSAAIAPFFAEWEKSYTLVQWDQPAGGSTDIHNYGKDRGEMSIRRYTADAISVTEQVLEKLGCKKLVLLGNSWGTLIGLEMIQARPELFSAYVGTSQAVGGEANALGYRLAIEAARQRNDATAVAALEKVGPPPYDTFEAFMVRQTYTNPPALTPSAAEQAAYGEMMQVMMTPPPAGAKYITRSPMPAGYDFIKNLMDTQRVMFKETWGWDAKKLGDKFAVPVFVYQGSDDINTPVAPAREFVQRISAPKKGFDVIQGAGHNTIAFRHEILRLVNRDVRPLVVESGKVAAR